MINISNDTSGACAESLALKSDNLHELLQVVMLNKRVGAEYFRGKARCYIRETLSTASDRLSELKIQKELDVAEKELKKKEEGLFLDQARIDIATEDEIDNIRGTDGIEFKLYQIFEVRIE